jgi:hypothetical protein
MCVRFGQLGHPSASNFSTVAGDGASEMAQLFEYHISAGIIDGSLPLIIRVWWEINSSHVQVYANDASQDDDSLPNYISLSNPYAEQRNLRLLNQFEIERR